ncbi:MAG: hypothetical protein AB7L13_08005 [Acidimicrobiia bacterium]
MSDQDDISEAVDGDVLGEDPFDADQPGVAAYPPDRALGADDPSLFSTDGIETRELRRYTEPVHDVPEVVIVEDAASTRDVEKDLVAEGVDIDADRLAAEEFGAEEAAVHVVEEDGNR